MVQKPPTGPKPTVQRPSYAINSTTQPPSPTAPSIPAFKSTSATSTSTTSSTTTTTSTTTTSSAAPAAPKIPRPKTGINVPMIYPPPNHMRWVPEQPEVLHVARDRLVASMMEHDANRLLSQSLVRNRVVYDSIEAPPTRDVEKDSKDDKNKKTTSDDPNGIPTTASTPIPEGQLRPYYTLENKKDTTLIFESRFESGNLRRAIQVYENEYDLIVKPDINTRG